MRQLTWGCGFGGEGDRLRTAGGASHCTPASLTPPPSSSSHCTPALLTPALLTPALLTPALLTLPLLTTADVRTPLLSEKTATGSGLPIEAENTTGSGSPHTVRGGVRKLVVPESSARVASPIAPGNGSRSSRCVSQAIRSLRLRADSVMAAMRCWRNGAGVGEGEWAGPRGRGLVEGGEVWRKEVWRGGEGRGGDGVEGAGRAWECEGVPRGV